MRGFPLQLIPRLAHYSSSHLSLLSSNHTLLEPHLGTPISLLNSPQTPPTPLYERYTVRLYTTLNHTATINDTNNVYTNTPSLSNAFHTSSVCPTNPTANTNNTPDTDRPASVDINRYVTLLPTPHHVTASSQRPLVLLYSWLHARPRHLDKYVHLYHRIGCDVLRVRMTPSQLAWPPRVNRAGGLVEQFLDAAQAHTGPERRPWLVHGLSVGGYLYSETVYKLVERADKYAELSARLRAQVFDSPVDVEGTSYGVSQSVSDNRTVQRCVQLALDCYLSAAARYSTRYYRRASFIFHTNPLRVPSLLLYSVSDRVAAAACCQRASLTWSRAGVPVYLREWQDTAHVQHMRTYPDEYRRHVYAFMRLLRLGGGAELAMEGGITAEEEEQGGCLRRVGDEIDEGEHRLNRAATADGVLPREPAPAREVLRTNVKAAQ